MCRDATVLFIIISFGSSSILKICIYLYIFSSFHCTLRIIPNQDSIQPIVKCHLESVPVVLRLGKRTLRFRVNVIPLNSTLSHHSGQGSPTLYCSPPRLPIIACTMVGCNIPVTYVQQVHCKFFEEGAVSFTFVYPTSGYTAAYIRE